jgi:hypothetical protein
MNREIETMNKVKCIDVVGLVGYLTLGKIYEARQKNGTAYLITNDTGVTMFYHDSRFIEVSCDEQSSERTTLPAIQVAAKVIDPNTDQEEERCWAAMRPARMAHECVCGISKDKCIYHS